MIGEQPDGRFGRYVGPRDIVIDGAPTPVPFWAPDRAFEGAIVIVVGGGPSHAAADLRLLAPRHPVIAINSACRHVRPAATERDILYFTDNSWAENRPELLTGWPGPVVTSNRNAKARLGEAVRRLDLVALTAAIGAGTDAVQASSGHTAACLAWLMGARRIVLLGFECRAVEGRTHGHGDYQQHDMGAFEERFLPGWRALAPAFRSLGADVVNATPGSAIDVFPFLSLAEAIAER